jgi:predicted NBD/HSP70 family sugar kinase
MKKTGIQVPKTIAQAEMRAINRSAVLEYFRLAQTASRTEIAKQLELSRPTVMRIVDDLLEEGLVVSTGQKESGRGRSRELLALNTKENAIIGVDIGGSHISGALVNIGGEILLEENSPKHWGSPDENFDQIAAFLQALLTRARQKDIRLLGIGAGVPGIIGADGGVVKLAPSLDWVDYPFLEKLRPLFDIPVFIENDVALAALGEYWFGAGVGISNLVMIAIGTGIGAGVILDGKLYRGHTNSAGEIGYMLPSLEHLNQQYAGFGALESIASGKGIADQAREMLKTTRPDLDAAYVFNAAQDGEAWAVELVEETIDHLSLMIANVSLCFDPEALILGGGVAGSLEALVNPIAARLEGVIPNLPQIKITALKEKAAILGAVVQVFHKITDYSVVHAA